MEEHESAAAFFEAHSCTTVSIAHHFPVTQAQADADLPDAIHELMLYGWSSSHILTTCLSDGGTCDEDPASDVNAWREQVALIGGDSV